MPFVRLFRLSAPAFRREWPRETIVLVDASRRKIAGFSLLAYSRRHDAYGF
jgi:hypothetical protein